MTCAALRPGVVETAGAQSTPEFPQAERIRMSYFNNACDYAEKTVRVKEYFCGC
jgi:hypothetical protein